MIELFLRRQILQTDKVGFALHLAQSIHEKTLLQATLDYEGESLRVDFRLHRLAADWVEIRQLSIFVLGAEPGQEEQIFNQEGNKLPILVAHWKRQTGKNLARIVSLIRDAAANIDNVPPDQQEAAQACQELFQGSTWTVRVPVGWDIQFAWALPPVGIRRITGPRSGTFEEYCRTVFGALAS